MRPSQPPKPAAWLPRHLAPENDALAGDLAEEFTCGRSSLWHWRQVAAAIAVSFARGLRGAAVCAGWAAMWTVFTASFGAWISWRILARRPGAPPYTAFPWPWSLIAEMTFDILLYTALAAPGVFLCLLLARRWSGRGFALAMGWVVAVLAIGENAAILTRPGVLFGVPFVSIHAPLNFVAMFLGLAIGTKRHTAARTV